MCVAFFSVDLFTFWLWLLCYCFFFCFHLFQGASEQSFSDLTLSQPSHSSQSQCCYLLVIADSCFLSFHLCNAWDHTHRRTQFTHNTVFKYVQWTHSTHKTIFLDGLVLVVGLLTLIDPLCSPHTLTLQCLEVTPAVLPLLLSAVQFNPSFLPVFFSYCV